MRVELELFATFAAFLPPGQRGPLALEVTPGTSVRDLLGVLGIPEAMPRIVLVNGRDATLETRLAEGDRLSLFPPLAGG